MLPLKDFNPTSRRAWVTVGLIAACALVWFVVQPASERLTTLRGSDAALSEDRFTLSRAAIPEEVSRRRPLTVGEIARPRQVGRRVQLDHAVLACDSIRRPSDVGARLDKPCFPNKHVELAVVTSMFLHGSTSHLLFNMLFLWIFGNNIEDRFGRVRYLVFYLAAGIIATLAHVALDPASVVPVVGASGAIAGVMGAYLALYPNVRILGLVGVFPIPIRAKWFLGFWFVSQFFLSPGSGVAWVAHVGGFAFGLAVGLGVRTLGATTARAAST